ncbi:hypothetical protein ACFFYR_23630 [Paraburkholderia dipogonis]|uniref:hypothetical protein n=1 Tax=Paraburkholderia dipogonis TaxID=1211383 RepID=UPI0035EF4CD5
MYNARPDVSPVRKPWRPVFDTVDALPNYMRTNDVHELWLMPVAFRRARTDLFPTGQANSANDPGEHPLHAGPCACLAPLLRAGGVIDLLGVPAINLGLRRCPPVRC